MVAPRHSSYIFRLVARVVCAIWLIAALVARVHADGRWEKPLLLMDSSASADCGITAMAYNDHDNAREDGADEATDTTSAYAVVSPGPGAFVTDPWGSSAGDDYAYAQIGDASEDNVTQAGSYLDDWVGNEPYGVGELYDNRHGTAEATWIIDAEVDDSWIESTITIVNESGEDSGDPCDIQYNSVSGGEIQVAGTLIEFSCFPDGHIEISGTLMTLNGPQDITGNYYGNVLTFTAKEFISPGVEFYTAVNRYAAAWMRADQFCDIKAEGLDGPGWASATLHAYSTNE